MNSIGIYARSYIDDLVMHNFWPEQNDTNYLMKDSTATVILDLLSKDETIKGMIINSNRVGAMLLRFRRNFFVKSFTCN